MLIDFSSPLGVRALERLKTESVIWLTTVSKDGTPQPKPVWFVWHDNKIYFMTGDGAAKIAHIERHPRIAFSFNTNAFGQDVQVLTGSGKVIGKNAAPDAVRKAYEAKYGPMILQIMHMPSEKFFEVETVLEFTPEKLRGM